MGYYCCNECGNEHEFEVTEVEKFRLYQHGSEHHPEEVNRRHGQAHRSKVTCCTCGSDFVVWICDDGSWIRASSSNLDEIISQLAEQAETLLSTIRFLDHKSKGG